MTVQQVTRTPRHAKLFELLHQHARVDAIAERLDTMADDVGDMTARHLQRRCLTSLGALPETTRDPSNAGDTRRWQYAFGGAIRP